VLKPLIRKGISIWDDTQIQAGDQWRNQIAEALGNARVGVPIASGQKTTLSQCGIGLSQRAKAFAMEFPAGRVATIVGVRGERVGILLSEVDLPRLGVLDPHIIRSLARV
jgi:hypothetical protein